MLYCSEFLRNVLQEPKWEYVSILKKIKEENNTINEEHI